MCVYSSTNLTPLIVRPALPKPPGVPQVTERTATSITLTWDSGNPEPVSYYVIQHKTKHSEDSYKEIDGVATTRYSVGGLSPYSDYEFQVVAVNNIGRGPPSEAIEAKTAEQAPSTAPRQVRGRMLSATTAIIHWDEPEEANGQVTGYRVYYTTDPSLHVNQWEKQIVRTSNFLTIPGLTPNKTYYIKVLAFTSVGDGPLSSDLQIIAKTGGGSCCFPFLLSLSVSLCLSMFKGLIMFYFSRFYSSLSTDGFQGRSQIWDQCPAVVEPPHTERPGQSGGRIRAALQERRWQGGGRKHVTPPHKYKLIRSKGVNMRVVVCFRSVSASNPPSPTYWRIWDPSPRTPFSWPLAANTASAPTPTRSRLKLLRHVGLLPFLEILQH